MYTFLTVVKQGNTTKAADALSMTQSSLGRCIKAMENELGCILMKRRRSIRNIELTDQNSDFTTIAKKLLNLWKEAKDIPDKNKHETLTISAVDSVSITLSYVYRVFLLQHPEVHISIFTQCSYTTYDFMEKGGDIDIAFIFTDWYSSKVDTILLDTEPMFFVCGKHVEYGECVHPYGND